MLEQLPFLLWPLLGLLCIAAIHVYLGLHVVEREVIFVDLSLAQMAVLGAAVASLWGHEPGEPVTIEASIVDKQFVELNDAADRPIKGYSGGMKRRLDLASALVHEPEVLFLDEPTTGLDPASRLTVWDEMRRINQRGTTVFLTTQYLEEADQLCDRLAIIDDGRIVREGTPARLKAELRERLGLAREATLDEVFLDATGRTRVAGEVQEVSA